jgi:predicted RNase H-like nuclease (RuvC/YqgF family)
MFGYMSKKDREIAKLNKFIQNRDETIEKLEARITELEKICRALGKK